MKALTLIFGVLFLLAAIPAGFYIWLVWGWYEGAMLLYNSIANATGAADFAWGAIKVIAGAALGGVVFWISVAIGGMLMAVGADMPSRKTRKW
jgi:hypothetical protein